MAAKIGKVLVLAAVSAAGAQPVTADPGKVVVFEVETVKLTEFEDPKPGSHKLPLTAHVLINMINAPVKIHADPACLTPISSLSPPGLAATSLPEPGVSL